MSKTRINIILDAHSTGIVVQITQFQLISADKNTLNEGFVKIIESDRISDEVQKPPSVDHWPLGICGSSGTPFQACCFVSGGGRGLVLTGYCTKSGN